MVGYQCGSVDNHRYQCGHQAAVTRVCSIVPSLSESDTSSVARVLLGLTFRLRPDDIGHHIHTNDQ